MIVTGSYGRDGVEYTVNELLQTGIIESIQLPIKTEFRNVLISKCTVINSKMNDPIFKSCLIEDSIFEKTDFSGSRFFEGNKIVGCKFSQVDFRTTGFGQKGAEFINCTFEKCDFRETSFETLSMINCKLSNCKINDKIIVAEQFIKCIVTGTLKDVKFIGQRSNAGLEVDLSQCKLRYVDFENCSLENTIPPKYSDHYYITNLREKCIEATKKLNAVNDLSLRKVLDRRLKRFFNLEYYIFNTKDLIETEGLNFCKTFFEILGVDVNLEI